MSERDASNERTHKLEELRFAKSQQWNISTATLTLLGAIFAAAHTLSPISQIEKVVATIIVTLVAAFGSSFLISLQSYISTTRLEINDRDYSARFRGLDILVALVASIIVGGIIVVYAIWTRW